MIKPQGPLKIAASHLFPIGVAVSYSVVEQHMGNIDFGHFKKVNISKLHLTNK